MKTIGFARLDTNEQARPWPFALLLLFSLGATVVVGEVLILLANTPEIARFFATCAIWVTQFIGPVWVALVPIAMGTLVATFLLVGDRLGVLQIQSPLPLQILTFSENTAPVLGLLGTFLGLWSLMITLDAGLPTADLVALLIRYGGEAFGSSVAGVIVQLSAYSARFFFAREEDL